MIIQYISDLHLEFSRNEQKVRRMLQKIHPIAPICILAGDIGYPFQPTYEFFLKELSNKFEHIFLIHGNHEYYQKKSMNDVVEKTHDITNNLKNVHFLNNSYFILDDYCFIGSVLWSNLEHSEKLINDFYTNSEFTIDNCNKWFKQNVLFLQHTIEMCKTNKKKAIVITHHLPSYECVCDFYKGNSINQYYASNCENLLQPPIEVWIYGHTHYPSKKKINGVWCIANPIGYPAEQRKPNYNEIYNCTKKFI